MRPKVIFNTGPLTVWVLSLGQWRVPVYHFGAVRDTLLHNSCIDEFRGRAGEVFGVSQTRYGVFLCISLAYIHVDYDQINLIYSSKCDYLRNSAIRENKHEQIKSALSARSNDISKLNTTSLLVMGWRYHL